jgi:flagellar hook-basal body complex protein FliE
MSDLRVGAVGPGASAPPAGGVERAAGGPGFGDALQQALDHVDRLQHAADEASQAFALGQTRDIATTLIAVEKANLAFTFALQIRNKLVDAYQEIMRMSM